MNPSLIRRCTVSGLLVIGAALMLCPPAVRGFMIEHLVIDRPFLAGGGQQDVPFGQPIHEQITRDALNFALAPAGFSIRVNGGLLGFTEEASEQIATENAQTDSRYRLLVRVHFDEESFQAAQTRLQGLRIQIARNARTNGTAARKLLGSALHTVQDFYAHSNWVEQGNTGPAGLGRPGTSFNVAGPGSATCTPVRLLPNVGLTSGWAPTLNLVLGDQFWLIEVNGVHKCLHGSPLVSSSSFPGQAAGLNKDGPARLGYDAARLLALDATRQYVQDIIDDLGDDSDSKCRLLGRIESDCSAQPEFWSGSYTITQCIAPNAVQGGLSPCTGTVHVSSSATIGQLSFQANGFETANARRDFTSFCDNADVSASISVGANIHFPIRFNFDAYDFSPGNSHLLFTIQTIAGDSISGTFQGTIRYPSNPVSERIVLEGTVRGHWSAARRATAFPKCTYPTTSVLCANNGAAPGRPPAGPQGVCDWRSLTRDARPDEWVSIP